MACHGSPRPRLQPQACGSISKNRSSSCVSSAANRSGDEGAAATRAALTAGDARYRNAQLVDLQRGQESGPARVGRQASTDGQPEVVRSRLACRMRHDSRQRSGRTGSARSPWARSTALRYCVRSLVPNDRKSTPDWASFVVRAQHWHPQVVRCRPRADMFKGGADRQRPRVLFDRCHNCHRDAAPEGSPKIRTGARRGPKIHRVSHRRFEAVFYRIDTGFVRLDVHIVERHRHTLQVKSQTAADGPRVGASV